MNPPVRIAISGAAGQIAYALLFGIARGDMLGEQQPVILHLLEIPAAERALQGVLFELEDCAFPLLKDVQIFTDPNAAFKDIDYALLVGARPRGPGMERQDLLAQNAEIFVAQGRALNAFAKRNVKVVVVGNPANTNAYITMRCAPDLDSSCFSAMLRLDHNRAYAQLAKKIAAPVENIERVMVWGNHSTTMYPDYRFARYNGDLLCEVIADEDWNRNCFIPSVASRGAAIIAARGSSSAASAASATMDHMRDWCLGSQNRWVTMGVCSHGEYGVPENLIFGYPVLCAAGRFQKITDLPIDDFAQLKFDSTIKELLEEKAAIDHLLP